LIQIKPVPFLAAFDFGRPDQGAASQRREEPLIYLNCAALPESVAESELLQSFGSPRGHPWDGGIGRT
jgi:hypothetical protein